MVRRGGDAPAVELREPGFYEVRRVGREREPVALVAVNLDPAESDLAALNRDELAGAVVPPSVGSPGGGVAATLTPEARERRQGLWWYLLVGVACLLVAEAVASTRLARRRVAV